MENRRFTSFRIKSVEDLILKQNLNFKYTWTRLEITLFSLEEVALFHILHLHSLVWDDLVFWQWLLQYNCAIILVFCPKSARYRIWIIHINNTVSIVCWLLPSKISMLPAKLETENDEVIQFWIINERIQIWRLHYTDCTPGDNNFQRD